MFLHIRHKISFNKGYCVCQSVLKYLKTAEQTGLSFKVKLYYVFRWFQAIWEEEYKVRPYTPPPPPLFSIIGYLIKEPLHRVSMVSKIAAFY